MESATKKGRKVKTEKKDFDNPFAVRLRELISERRVTQTEVAEHISATRQALNKWCNGETYPDILIASEIADYFGVSLDYLVGKGNIRSSDDDMKVACKVTGLSEKAINKLKEFNDWYDIEKNFAELSEIRNELISTHLISFLSFECLDIQNESKLLLSNPENVTVEDLRFFSRYLGISSDIILDSIKNKIEAQTLSPEDREKKSIESNAAEDNIEYHKYKAFAEAQRVINSFDVSKLHRSLSKEDLIKYLGIDLEKKEREQNGEHNSENE